MASDYFFLFPPPPPPSEEHFKLMLNNQLAPSVSHSLVCVFLILLVCCCCFCQLLLFLLFAGPSGSLKGLLPQSCQIRLEGSSLANWATAVAAAALLSVRISRKFRRFIPPPLLLSIFSGFCSFRGGGVGKCGKSLIVPKDENDDDSTSLNGHAASGGATTNPANMAPNVLCLLCKCSLGTLVCLLTNVSLCCLCCLCCCRLCTANLHAQFGVSCFLLSRSVCPTDCLSFFILCYCSLSLLPLTHH